MNPVPPHPLLSAYLDGELSPSERGEVERLLEHSPEARQELLELEQVGRLLRQLPPQSLPQNFAPQVLDACLCDTGVFESQTPPPVSARPKLSEAETRSEPKWVRERNKGWRGLAAVSMAVSALGLVVLLSWPQPDETNRESIARKTSPPAANADVPGLLEESAANTLDMHLDGDAAKAKNDADFRQEGQTEPAKDSGVEGQVQSAMVASANALTGNAPAGGVDRKVSALGTKELKELPIAQLAEVMDPQGDHVAVVKLVVANREQGLKDLKQLLQKRQIAHEPPSAFKKGEAEAVVSGSKGDSNLIAVYVETSEDQLAFVMQDLQKEAAFQKLTMDAPVEASQIDPYLRSPDAKVSGESRNRSMGFSGVGVRSVPAPNAIRNSEPMKLEMKADLPPKPNPEPANPKKRALEKSSPKTAAPKPGDPAQAGLKTPEEPAALSRPSEASFGAAGSDPLREKEAPLPQGRRSENETQPKMGDKETVPESAEPAAVRSVQRELLLSTKQLEALQKPLAAPEDQPQPDVRRKRGAAEPSTSGKPVQVLFVLVDQTPSTEAKSQAPAANAPSSTD